MNYPSFYAVALSCEAVIHKIVIHMSTRTKTMCKPNQLNIQIVFLVSSVSSNFRSAVITLSIRTAVDKLFAAVDKFSK